MKFYRLHEEPDTVLTSPAYARHSMDRITEEYPGFEVIEDSMCPAGYSYLINKDKLKEEYETKLKGSDGE